MAAGANVFRLTAAEALHSQAIAAMKLSGIVIKSYRDYASPTHPSMTQAQVATAAATNQPTISDLERGKKIPNNAVLTAIMNSIGLNIAAPEPLALFNVLVALRDNMDNLAKLKKHKP